MIRDNIAGIKRRIDLACARAGRDAKEIITVAVSKGRTVEEMREALACGITDIGENKVQEAILKYNNLTSNTHNLKPVKWHMVGHLQTNKAKDAVGIFDLIHSLDSLRLAQEINRQAQRLNKIQDILIEVNTSGESSKFGVKPEEAVDVIEEISGLKNICLKGLMVIAPIADNPEKARPYFKLLREIGDKVIQRLKTSDQRLILSMGMSDDFEVAIEEGADIIRLGRAIFGVT